MHDIHYLKDVKELFGNCIITGDKGYISKQQQINLFESARIQLDVPLRPNQQEGMPLIHILRKVRKRIETIFYTYVIKGYSVIMLNPLLALDPGY